MNIKKMRIFSFTTCKGFDNAAEKYSKYTNKFETRCGSEITPVPYYAAAFITKYHDRLLYVTDNNPSEHIYLTTVRVL